MMLLFSMGTALRQVFLFLVIGVLTQLFPFMQPDAGKLLSHQLIILRRVDALMALLFSLGNQSSGT